MRKIGILSTLTLLLVAGCQSGGGPSRSMLPAGPTGGGAVTCERMCNSQYDSCMDRFSGVTGGSSVIGRSSDSTNLGPNDVCPDQLKTCLRRCGS